MSERNGSGDSRPDGDGWSNKHDVLPEIMGAESRLYGLATRGMLEVVRTIGRVTSGPEPSLLLQDIAPVDHLVELAFVKQRYGLNRRYELWPDAFMGAVVVAHNTARHLGENWHEAMNLPVPRFSETLPDGQAPMITGLLEAIAWSRVPEEATGCVDRPYVAASGSMFRESAVVQATLLGLQNASPAEEWPGVTWKGVIDAMLEDQIPVGRSFPGAD